MELPYLRVFNAVAQFQSFTKAAQHLHISQPALSIQIKKLELDLNLKLFDKINNRIFLTDNGNMLYEYTQRIFELVSEVESKLLDEQSSISGNINIGGSNTPGTYILPEIIGKFKNEYPLVNVNLHIANTSEISHLVNNGTLDFAINGGNSHYSDNICVEKLFDDELIIVASPKNKYSLRGIIDIENFKDLSFIVHQNDSQLYTYYLKIIKEIGIPEKTGFSLGNIAAIKRAVSANLGVSLIPYAAVSVELKTKHLKKLAYNSDKWYYPYSLIYNKNKYLSLASKKMIDMIKNIMK